MLPCGYFYLFTLFIGRQVEILFYETKDHNNIMLAAGTATDNTVKTQQG